MSYDNTKQVIVRKIVTDKPNAPVLSVEFEMNGQKYQAGLWAWKRKDGSPVLDKHGNAMYQGEWKEDNYTAAQQQQGMQDARAAIQGDPAPPSFDNFEDDSIPF